MDASISSIHALRRSGRLGEAIEMCRSLVERQPNDAEPLHLLGLLSNELGRREEAIGWLHRSIELRPSEGRYRRNLAAVLAGAGRHAEAEPHARRAAELELGEPIAWVNLAAALEGREGWAEAEACYRRALALRPVEARAHAGLGNALFRLGRVEAGLAEHRRAAELSPGLAAAQRGMALALAELGRAPEAVECWRRIVELEPASAGAHSDLLLLMHHCQHYGPGDLLKEARRYGSRFDSVRPVGTATGRHHGPRLRVGYVSPDFRAHTVPHLIEPVLEAHDRGKFEIFCYSAVQKPDQVTKRLASLAEHWTDIAPMSDESAAQRIHADGIDILVDLTGHMGGSRLPVLARRPAPVQIQIGHPATTGLAAMDYHIADPHCAPDGVESHFTEKLLRLPDTGWMYKPSADAPPIAPLPARASGRVTFGCLNNPAKISDMSVALWSNVLKAVPRSKLLLLSPVPNAHLLDRFARQGIERNRIELTPRCSRQQYLELFSRIDIALDPFPYAGDTTTCDGLWMGIPAITLASQSMASRRGATILRNVGLGNLVAETAEQYVALATCLASDVDSLAALRATLRERMRSSPMTDGPRYTAALERAYRMAAGGR